MAGLFLALATALGFVLDGANAARAADVDEARQKFIQGHYKECMALCREAIKAQEFNEEWRLLLVQSLLTVGQYANAQSAIATNLELYPSSLRLRLLAREVYLQNNQRDKADALLEEFGTLIRSRASGYRSAADMVALGQAALLLGIDARQVLDQLFDRAKKADPSCRDVYLAMGGTALDKSDFALAAKVFAEGLKKFPNDPDFHFGLARAYAVSNRRLMIDSLETAMSENTNHVPSFLLLADHLIDGEEYAAAEKPLAQVFEVNPWQPEGWAYRAVIAHLRGDTNGEAEAREKGLRFWKSNPEVDYLIGEKLSQKYRFAEATAAQRRALELDTNYLPAKIQLAQDLLRLGEEHEGWDLAEEVQRADGYDVTAFNLGTLHDNLAKFQTLTNEHFILRMSRREAAIYGRQVLEHLSRARTNLCAKYGMELERPTVVEIFPEQKDFGVRTFGMPGNPGFLGVCFGNVITANSPASQSHPANWQAVLWHEFCHVVTLNLTHNKMPRWLSEGISVYEESQANPAWGQAMNPHYREMVLGKDLTPVGDLSAAFLAPKSDLHLQFAYFESSLVVEFLIQRYGQPALRQILTDLGAGVEINQAIAAHTAPLEQIENDFAAFAKGRAEKLAPGLDWEKPPPHAEEEWFASHPTNFYTLTRQGKKLLAEKKYSEALVPLNQLLALYPADTQPDNAHKLLAEAYRNLGQTNKEQEILTSLASMDADDLETFLRLTVLCSAAKDWTGAAQNAERFLAVNPLLPEPYRLLASASEALGKRDAAIQAYQTMILLDPPDPADAHFRLARLLHQAGDPGARRQVLQALEEAPRFRDAHKLLLEIISQSKTNAQPAANDQEEKGPAK